MTTGNCSVLEYFALTLRALVSAAAVMLVLKTMQANATVLAPVIWNATNPIFKSSKNDHVIEVKLFDDIDFICPYYDHTVAENNSDSYEYLTIYMVNRREYDDCIVDAEGTATPVLNCSSPHQRKRFTILFEPFQSIPNAHEYHPGSSYYFITTSTGKLEGLDNLVHGACLLRNMKLTIKVCCHNIVVNGNVNLSNSISKTRDMSFTPKQPTQKENDPMMNTEKRPRRTSTPATQSTPDPNQQKMGEDGETEPSSSLQGPVIQVINRRHDSVDGSSKEVDPIEDRTAAKHERFLSSGDASSCARFQSINSYLRFIICLTILYVLFWHS